MAGESRKLIARIPILYLAKQYKDGEELPVNDTVMVNAWIEAGSAFWKEDDSAEQPKPKAKAKAVTATPGVAGLAAGAEKDEEDGDLVGRVPTTSKRKKK